MRVSTNKEIIERLKEEVNYCGLSKTEIADKTGISKPTLSQYLSGKIMPSLPTFAKLCQVIDCSADYILGIDQQES